MSSEDDEDDGQPGSWGAFLSALPPSWLPVAVAFDKASGVVEGNVEPDGTWTLDLLFGVSDLRSLLRSAPVEFASIASGQSWWMDQHLEDEGGVAVASTARALVSWNDNFASGLSATLSVHASDDAYEVALADARGRHAEGYGEDEHEDLEDDVGG